jgi:TM2 domain
MSEKKTVWKAYLLSCIGGLFGLYHIYLGRTQHALLWVTTIGGFGLGWLYEFLFLISKYVLEANDDPSIVEEYQIAMRRRKSPAYELSRLSGKIIRVEQ